MKKLKLILVLLAIASLTAFTQEKHANIDKSIVKWTGKKIGGSHWGEVNIQKAVFNFQNGHITGLEVLMDMHSMTVLDIENTSSNKKLEGHLKSADFFGVEKYPTASFMLTEAEKFVNGEAKLSGKLRIKDRTEEISFIARKNGNTYKAKIEVDRSKFDVRYGSNSFFDNLGDKAINDIFSLEIKLVI